MKPCASSTKKASTSASRATPKPSRPTAGLEALGLSFIPASTLTTLNAVHVPESVDDARVRRRLLAEYGIEIGAGLGPFKGQAWRIGLMGHSSSRRNVMLILAALEALLADEGLSIDRGAASKAAQGVWG